MSSRLKKSVSSKPLSLKILANVCLRFIPLFQVASVKKIVAHDAPDSAKTVFPADLFSLFIRAPVIRNADLVNADVFDPGNFCSDFRLESETVLFQQKRLHHFRVE